MIQNIISTEAALDLFAFWLLDEQLYELQEQRFCANYVELDKWIFCTN